MFTISPAPLRLSLPLLALVVMLLAYASHGALWSDSVDLAHHYALIARLAEHGNGAFPYDASLGEMNVYPRHAHQLAVMLGRLLGSPMRGMQALSILSMATLWAGLTWLLMQLPQRMATVAALGLAALLIANRYLLHLPIYGDELVGNFFLPQLLGQALAMLLILVCWHLDQKGAAPTLRYVVLAPLVILMTGVHLLPALILLSMMALLIATDWFMQWRRAQPKMRVWPSLLALLCAAAGVALHPDFATMRAISRNNGYIPLPYLDSVPAQMAYCAMIALASALLVLYWMRQQRLIVLKYVGLYGLAVSGLALAQGLALQFDMGSDYALRKYAFSLNTVALLMLALLPALLLARRTETERKPWARWLLPPLLTVLACLVVAAQPFKYKARELAALENSVQVLYERLGSPVDGQIDYVIGAGPDRFIDYMLSIGLTHTLRDGNANLASLLFQSQIAVWRNVGRVITAEHSMYDRYPACRIGIPVGGLVALDGACAARHGMTGTRIDFTAANAFFPCALTGVSRREPGGSWTEARLATLRCPRLLVNGKPPGRVQIEGHAFHSEVSSQRAVIAVDGLPPQTRVYGATAPSPVVLPLRADSKDAEVLIQIEMPDARSPQQLGLSSDQRVLGLSVFALEFLD